LGKRRICSQKPPRRCVLEDTFDGILEDNAITLLGLAEFGYSLNYPIFQFQV
jgi:hypothetical protein